MHGTLRRPFACDLSGADFATLIMAGKILPYVVLGYVQLGVILGAAFVLFNVPMVGSVTLLLAMIGVFMLANLGVGFTFSTLAKNQLQALQLTFFFFLFMVSFSRPRPTTHGRRHRPSRRPECRRDCWGLLGGVELLGGGR